MELKAVLKDAGSEEVVAAAHVTLPRSMRWAAGRRVPGAVFRFPRRPLEDGKVMRRDVTRVTSPGRTNADCTASGTPPDRIVLAVRQTLRRRAASPNELRRTAQGRSHRVQELLERVMRGGGEHTRYGDTFGGTRGCEEAHGGREDCGRGGNASWSGARLESPRRALGSWLRRRVGGAVGLWGAV